MEFYVIDKIEVDFNQMKHDMRIVSFNKEVLKKYKNNSEFQIELNENAGTLKKEGENGWTLQIDVGSKHISTLIYKLKNIPKEEQQHFQRNNIYPKELGPAAHRRWTKGEF